MKRTEKEARVETRKRKALRRTLICLAMLAVFSTLHLYNFTPMQAMRYAEGQVNSGKTRFVRRLPGQTWNQPVFMTANDHAVLISQLSFHPLIGWSALTTDVLDCGGGSDVQVGFIYRGGTDTETHWGVYGRVKAPEAAAIQAESRWAYWDENTETQIQMADSAFTMTAADWTQNGGWRYFYRTAALAEPLGKQMPYNTEATLSLLDASENSLGEYVRDYNDSYNRFVPVSEAE